MANIFKTIFGGGKKQDAVQTYFPSQDPRYQRAQKELEDILSNRGYYKEAEMGYTPSMISATIAPYATARRENLKNYEIPLISAQASARGLGRSTIPVNRIALSGQEAERDIESRIAELTTQSEQLKGQQKGQNLQAYLNAIQGETGLATQETAAQQEARNRAAAASETSRIEDRAMTQNAAIFGAQMTSPFLSESLKTIIASKEKPYTADWGKAIDSAMGGGGNAAMVNISKGSDNATLQTILKLLAMSGGIPA